MNEEFKSKLPEVPEGLLTYLDNQFPNYLPMEELTPFALGKLSGKQELIQHLKSVKKWSEEIDV